MKPRQRATLEAITGQDADRWHPEAVRAYFSYTNQGITIAIPDKAKPDLDELMFLHKMHAYDVECWKVDFRKGLLWLEDFMDQGYPKARIKHIIEVYISAMPYNYLPSKYKEWASQFVNLKETNNA